MRRSTRNTATTSSIGLLCRVMARSSAWRRFGFILLLLLLLVIAYWKNTMLLSSEKHVSPMKDAVQSTPEPTEVKYHLTGGNATSTTSSSRSTTTTTYSYRLRNVQGGKAAETAASDKKAPASPSKRRPHGTRPRILANPNSIFPLIESLGSNDDDDDGGGGGGGGSRKSSPHFLTTLSGCRMARWILPILGERPFCRDCYNEQQVALHRHSDEEATIISRLLSKDTIHLLQANDTMYITYDQVEDFVQEGILDLIQVDVVLICHSCSTCELVL